jgi:hypothetical protein
MELRDRIAAVIYGSASQWDSYPWDALAEHIQALYLGQADAVICDLGLQPEISFGTNYPNVPVTDRKCVRWVTDWKADDE